MATACLLTAGRAGSDYPRLVPTWRGTKRDEQSTSAPTLPCVLQSFSTPPCHSHAPSTSSFCPCCSVSVSSSTSRLLQRRRPLHSPVK